MIAAVLFGYVWAAFVIVRALVHGVLLVLLLGSAPGQALVRGLGRSGRFAVHWVLAGPRGLWRAILRVGRSVRTGAQYMRAAASERTIIGLTGLTITSAGLSIVSPAIGVIVFGVALLGFAFGPPLFPSLMLLRRGRR